MPERIDPESEELMEGEILKIKASFACPSFTQSQITEIGRFLRVVCGITEKKCDIIDRRVYKITVECPGYDIVIYCGIMGESIDVILEDEKIARHIFDPDVMMEKIWVLVKRRETLVQMGYGTKKSNDGERSDNMMIYHGDPGKDDVYTKPVATHHTGTLLREMEKIYQGLS